ncbi:MAG TPA: hypothetical protein VHD32_13265 [Candidatus Didemnitutus sp.]|nr:hypothetical protein [Candidatus Didemnitutus sp.]
MFDPDLTTDFTDNTDSSKIGFGSIGAVHEIRGEKGLAGYGPFDRLRAGNPGLQCHSRVSRANPASFVFLWRR